MRNTFTRRAAMAAGVLAGAVVRMTRFVFTGRVEGRAAMEHSFVSDPAAWLVAMLGGGETSSGVTVTPTTALQCPPVYACVRNISEDLASLPFILYKRLAGRGRARAPEHPLYPILHDSPNDEMDAMQFVETLQAHCMLRPCAYAEIVRNGRGDVTALWPLHPDKVEQLRVNGERVYKVTLPDGQRDKKTGLPWTMLSSDLVFRLRGLSLDGWDGLSTVQLQRESIGLTIALERYGASLFGNDATPGGALKHSGTLSDEAIRHLRESFEERHRGLSNAHRVAILEEGMEWQALGLRNDQAQFNESRKLQIEDTARIYRIPQHMVGHLEHATFSNIEHQGIEYVVYTMRPRAVRWERAVTTQLLTPKERSAVYAEFLLDALLRGDAKSRADTLAVERQNGIINADEWREMNNLNEIEGGAGKVYLVNGNMVPVDQVIAGKKDQEKTPPPPKESAERAFGRLFESALARARRKEAAAIERAARREEDLAAFETWADDFYGEHADELREGLQPVVRALAEILGAPESEADAYAAAAARRHARLAKRALGDAVRIDAKRYVELASSWAEKRPAGDAGAGARECGRAIAELVIADETAA